MKIKKILSIVIASAIVMSMSTVFASAASTDVETEATQISANIQGADFSLARAADSNAYAVSIGTTDIKDDNHLFNKDVEVWCVSKTWLESYYSGTADGIPDWTLMAMCQMSVSNGTPKYVTSPTCSAYNKTSVTAQTKEVKAKDGGNASATGYHTVKDYYGKIVWKSETYATEKF